MKRGAAGGVRFGDYSREVPPGIPQAVQQATARFLTNRRQRVAELSEWEELRQAASDLREHTLRYLDVYLEQLAERVQANGGQVHWAADAAEACRIVLEIAREHGSRRAVKVKSMASEEIGLNAALEQAGLQVLETDLGEFIIQLAGTGPSHIIAPAVHLKKEEVAALFRQKLGVEAPADPVALTELARHHLREQFLAADLGISGANFLVAETGTLVIVTNEGNGRMCTTLPEVHVAVVGIEKVIPDWSALTVMLKLLARSATGQKLSTYTSFISGPRRSSAEGGPRELHLVLLDNGRSRMLREESGRETLKCIRCGCCLNVCPVYQQVGGFAYGWFISGPIGAIFTPQMLGLERAGELPFASTLCGACAEVCPVKVPIPEILLELRRRSAEGEERERPVISPALRLGAALSGWALRTGWLYRLGSAWLAWLSDRLQQDGWLQSLPAPLSRWTRVRPLPAFRGGFHRWLRRRERLRNQEGRQ